MCLCVCTCVFVCVCLCVCVCEMKPSKKSARLTSVVSASLVAQMVKNLPAVQQMQVRSLGQEDPLEKGMATHSSVLAWRIPRTEEPGGLQPMGSQSRTQPGTCRHVHADTGMSPYTNSLKYKTLIEIKDIYMTGS